MRIGEIIIKILSKMGKDKKYQNLAKIIIKISKKGEGGNAQIFRTVFGTGKGAPP
jgi:hypothetical protein